MRTVVGENFSEAYQRALVEISEYPDYVSSPRGMKIKESLNYIIEVKNPLSNLYKNEVRSSPVDYICKELIWYLDGNPDVSYIEKHAALWGKITNPDTNDANSNYGYLAFRKKVYDKYNNWSFSQFYWAFKTLKEDKDSRQAIIHFNAMGDCQYFGVKDFVCTLTAIFHIRENKLFMTVVMRSQDIIFGLPADFAWFSILQQQMFSYLKQVYPDLELGSYTHIVHSLHLYAKHFELVDEMLKSDFTPWAMPPLREDLVTMLGNPTQITKQLIWDVHNDCDIVYDDTLVQVIFSGATQ